VTRENLCGATDPNVPCTAETCQWFINAPQYYNCFLVYKYYIHDCSHTLQEIANLLNISHTTVKQVETSALNKLRKAVQDGEIDAKELSLLFSD